MLKVYDINVYVLLDPSAYLSFVTPLLAIKFYLCPKILRDPCSIHTNVGELFTARRVYDVLQF